MATKLSLFLDYLASHTGEKSCSNVSLHDINQSSTIASHHSFDFNDSDNPVIETK